MTFNPATAQVRGRLLDPASRQLIPRQGTLRRGTGDAMRRHHYLDMQVRCGDGIRPVPTNLREPPTAGGLRADTMVSIASLPYNPRPVLTVYIMIISSIESVLEYV